jgi:hypothetical protein
MTHTRPSRTLTIAQVREYMYLFTSSVALSKPFTVKEDSANSPAYNNPRMVMSSNVDACHL